MSRAATLHEEQVAFWSGPGGENWTADQDRVDAMLAPVADAILAKAAARPGERVLDIGCGFGITAARLAQAVGPKGHVIGLDVSPPMLALAKTRSAGMTNIEWVEADAATHTFPPASLDLLFSRFGVMFFGDPVAAFANLRRAVRPTGRLVFACWRGLGENPWLHVPRRAVAAHVALPPPPEPDDPGMLSFADPGRVSRILTQAGFSAPTFEKADFDVDIGAGRGLEDAVAHMLSMRPTRATLENAPEPARAAATEAVRAALAPFAAGGQVALGGAIWLVKATPA